LWGVLLAGLSSGMLWEHGGDVFGEHLSLLLVCLIALPVIGGFLTPERPEYTVIVFAVGSFPPLPDMGPLPIGLWPFLWVFAEFDPLTPALFPLVVLVTVFAAAVMCAPFLPLVYLGWAIRRRCGL
jgi:hypothetical protein